MVINTGLTVYQMGPIKFDRNQCFITLAVITLMLFLQQGFNPYVNDSWPAQTKVQKKNHEDSVPFSLNRP